MFETSNVLLVQIRTFAPRAVKSSRVIGLVDHAGDQFPASSRPIETAKQG